MIGRRLDPVVAALCAAHTHEGEPENLIRRLALDLLVDTGAGIPVNLEMIASFRGAVVESRPTEGAGSIRWDGRKYVITVSAAENALRQRFTLAHEVIHILFMEASGNRSARVHQSVATFDRSTQEEYLCDVGAGELLMPGAAVLELLPRCPTMADVLAVSERCNASVEASARRVVELSGMAGTVVVLESKLKPTEVRQLARRREAPVFPGMEPQPPRAKLRVRYATSQGLDAIRADKSVDDACPLTNIFESGSVDFVGHTGLLARELAVSARVLPLWRADERVERVVALAFEAESWRARAVLPLGDE